VGHLRDWAPWAGLAAALLTASCASSSPASTPAATSSPAAHGATPASSGNNGATASSGLTVKQIQARIGCQNPHLGTVGYYPKLQGINGSGDCDYPTGIADNPVAGLHIFTFNPGVSVAHWIKDCDYHMYAVGVNSGSSSGSWVIYGKGWAVLLQMDSRSLAQEISVKMGTARLHYAPGLDQPGC
jgi:hypothetical protein